MSCTKTHWYTNVRKIQLIILVLNKDKMSETLEISFEIVNMIDTGIYECYPIGKTYGYPIWIVCSFDFTSLKYEDLSGLVLRKIKEEQYVSNTNKGKGKSIFVIPKIVFIELSSDEDGQFGYYNASDNFTDNPYKPDLAKEMREKVKEDENTTTTPTKPTTRVKVAPQLLRNQRPPRDRSPEPEPKNDYGKNIREKLFKMIESYEPTQPMTSDFKKKKTKKSLKKKTKKSLKKKTKKSKKKSKTSIKCKKTPYAWKSSSIKKSPFRKLKRAKDAETKYKAGQSIGFTAISSLKSLGRIPRSDGCYVLGAKYSKLKRH